MEQVKSNQIVPKAKISLPGETDYSDREDLYAGYMELRQQRHSDKLAKTEEVLRDIYQRYGVAVNTDADSSTLTDEIYVSRSQLRAEALSEVDGYLADELGGADVSNFFPGGMQDSAASEEEVAALL